LKLVFSEAQLQHRPGGFLVRGLMKPAAEQPERATRLRDAALAAGHQLVEPRDHGAGPRAAVHSARYLRFLETAHERWRALEGAAEDAIPNVHPNQFSSGYPEAIVGRVGFHMADTAAPLMATSWPAIVASANAAVHAARRVTEGVRAMYALCRPPGHHAFADQGGGFCYLNNTAIAAAELKRKFARVAVLDIDVHHGNGTQGIFWERGDVLTVSIHADPAHYYPFFWGYAGETGAGAGEGANLNIPLALGTGMAGYRPALEAAVARIRSFGADALVVALGLDAYEGDPLSGLKIPTEGFGEIGEAIAGLGLPTVLVQEGGYLSEALGRNLVTFLEGFEAAMPARA
jgi:acetoin utilization deacetylase AcuC-like enzyme